MTTLTVTLAAVCAGGNHLTFNVTGDAQATQVLDLTEIAAAPTQDDAVALIRILARMAKNGRTLAQARTLLQGGVTVTV